MKKILILTLFAMLPFTVCFSQIETPVQPDTLVISKMQYQYDVVKPEDYPFDCVIRTSSSFIFGDREVKIENFRKLRSKKEILLEYDVDNGNKLMLLEMGNTIRIYYDGYILGCFKQGYMHDSKPDDDDKSIFFGDVEKKPSFRGGSANNFSIWVAEHMKYPNEAKKNGIQGRVMVRYTVDITGLVTDVEVIRGVDPYLDAEAIRVVSESPKWKPGEIGGKPVKVFFVFPLIFQLK